MQTLLAEWGDRSQIATIALVRARAPRRSSILTISTTWLVWSRGPPCVGVLLPPVIVSRLSGDDVNGCRNGED